VDGRAGKNQPHDLGSGGVLAELDSGQGDGDRGVETREDGGHGVQARVRGHEVERARGQAQPAARTAQTVGVAARTTSGRCTRTMTPTRNRAVEGEALRVVDHDVRFGVSTDVARHARPDPDAPDPGLPPTGRR
jgi:hypothetical protein